MKSLSIAAGFLLLGSAAQADETSDAINALKKQIEELRAKLNKLEARQSVPAPETVAPGGGAKNLMPAWVTHFKLFGDLRLRYDGIYAPANDFVTRQRGRFRLRAGATATLQDDFELGLRLASAPSIGGDQGGDPLSTNATFENNASRKPLGVDWAYIKWAPVHNETWNASITLGKMENPPNYSEMVFDVDYTPEGAAEQFNFKPHARHQISGYLGQYFLEELGFSGKDSFLFLEQLRWDADWSSKLKTSLGISGLSIANPESLTTANVPDSNHGNTRTAAGVLVNDYQLAILDGSVTWWLDDFVLYPGKFPIKLGGEYIKNFGATRDNIAYAFGPTFGRSGKKGAWEVSYRYQELQADANYEELTASDSGAFFRRRPAGEPAALRVPSFLQGTNIRGHIFRVSYSPADFLSFQGSVWVNEPIRGIRAGDKYESVRAIVDAVWRF